MELGYSDEQIESLIDQGVLGVMTPPE
jgi:hypothetical protein